MYMSQFQNKAGKPILLEMVQAIQANKAYLGEIDGLIGDGDHGMNMNKGFTVFYDRFPGADIGFTDGLFELGNILLSEIGGSMGPIYGTIFMEMSDVAGDAEAVTLALFSNMLSSALSALYEIVDARVGDKTLVDTLAPACGALEANLGGSFAGALDAMVSAAEAGKDSTVDLVAKYGRSSRLSERSRGVLDAGATSCFLLLEAMAKGIKGVLV